MFLLLLFMPYQERLCSLLEKHISDNEPEIFCISVVQNSNSMFGSDFRSAMKMKHCGS
jgi:hypothetical protein